MVTLFNTNLKCFDPVSKPSLRDGESTTNRSIHDKVYEYSDTSANEDNSFRNHIHQTKSSLAETSRCLERKQPSRVGVSPLCGVVSSFLCQTQTEKISSWNGPTVHVCCFMLVCASTKTFVSRIHIRQPSPKNSEKNLRQPKNSLAGSLISRGITVLKLIYIKGENPVLSSQRREFTCRLHRK